MKNVAELTAAKQVFRLHRGRRRVLEIVADGSGLFRIIWPDVGPSQAANLSRCRDAARLWAEAQTVTEDRKRSGARRLKSLGNFSWSAPLVRLNGEGGQ